jgi:hypothetical protein
MPGTDLPYVARALLSASIRDAEGRLPANADVVSSENREAPFFEA